MINLRTVLTIILVLSTGVIYYISSPNSDNNHKFNGDICPLDAKSCHLSSSLTPDAQVEFLLDSHPVIVENEFTLTLKIDTRKKVTLSQAHIEGVNMYMGKIPVFFQQVDDEKWQGSSMLGMCSEPDMTWKLVVELTIAGNPQLIQFQFNSMRAN